MSRFSGRYLEATINHRVGHPPPCERPGDVVCQACGRERQGCATIVLRGTLDLMTNAEVLGLAAELIMVARQMATDWPRRDPNWLKTATEALRGAERHLFAAATYPPRPGGNAAQRPPDSAVRAF
jgi:hypothetical protein